MHPGRLHPDPCLEVRWRLPLRSGSIPRVLPPSTPRPSFFLPGMPCVSLVQALPLWASSSFLRHFIYYLFIYFWLCRVFVAAHGLSLLAAMERAGAARWLWCVGLSLQWLLCRGAQALELTGSVVVAHGLSCPETCGIFIPRPGIKSVSPSLAGRFLTTGPPGESLGFTFFIYKPGS